MQWIIWNSLISIQIIDKPHISKNYLDEPLKFWKKMKENFYSWFYNRDQVKEFLYPHQNFSLLYCLCINR